MRISYPQFCAKGTAAFIAIFSFARRKPPSVFLRGAYPDLPLRIVYIADGIWLCADWVSALLRPAFSRGCAGTSFMPRSARSPGLSCSPPPSFTKKAAYRAEDGAGRRSRRAENAVRFVFSGLGERANGIFRVHLYGCGPKRRLFCDALFKGAGARVFSATHVRKE